MIFFPHMINLCIMYSYDEMNFDIGSVSGKMNTVIYKNAIIMLHVHVLLIIFVSQQHVYFFLFEIWIIYSNINSLMFLIDLHFEKKITMFYFWVHSLLVLYMHTQMCFAYDCMQLEMRNVAHYFIVWYKTNVLSSILRPVFIFWKIPNTGTYT